MAEEPETTDKTDLMRLARHARGPHVFLAVGCAFIVSLLVASYMQAALGLGALSSLDRLNLRTDHLDDLMMLITDAETGVRGYQLTGDTLYLDPYLDAVPKLAASTEAIRHDYAGRSEEMKTAEQIILLSNWKLAVLNQAIMNRERAKELDRQQLAHGKGLMDDLRRQVRVMKAHLAASSKASIGQSIDGFKQTRLATILLAIGALTLLVALFAVSQRQQQLRDRITRILHEENELLDRQVKARTEELAQLATYLTNAREMEKSHLARELHDELGALLTAAKLDAGWIERKLPKEALPAVSDRLLRLQETLGSGIALKRRITNDLHPALLYDLGLVSSLRVLGEDFTRTDEIPVRLDLPEEDISLPEEMSLALFRIVQEALTNIRKYAKARSVSISLVPAEGGIALVVEDDGIGFNIDSPTLARHGLAGMKHRVQMLAGRIQVISRPGAGTRIEVQVPLS